MSYAHAKLVPHFGGAKSGARETNVKLGPSQSSLAWLWLGLELRN
jgi:hypothetical protein